MSYGITADGDMSSSSSSTSKAAMESRFLLQANFGLLNKALAKHSVTEPTVMLVVDTTSDVVVTVYGRYRFT